MWYRDVLVFKSTKDSNALIFKDEMSLLAEQAKNCSYEGLEDILKSVSYTHLTGENYKTSDMYVWRLMVDNTYGHYAYRISGGYLFHSVPYLKAANNTLETEEYNKLGTFASLGCVRMCVRDVLWLYENCPQGTTAVSYTHLEHDG